MTVLKENFINLHGFEEMIVSVRLEYTDLKHAFIILHLLLITLSLVIYKELASQSKTLFIFC